jgi:hypothetical protein
MLKAIDHFATAVSVNIRANVGSSKIIVFITYTMKNPVVGGAFMRSLRLAHEMARRRWQPIICNDGPSLLDPKIRAAAGSVEFVRLNREKTGLTEKEVISQFAALNPEIVVMGEGPIDPMRVYYDAARHLRRPFVVLDQYYNHWLLPQKAGVDLVLMYALSSFWDGDLRLAPPYEITPPFIEAVTAKSALPVPAGLHNLRWITLIAYDSYVLDRGLELLSKVSRRDLAIIAISQNPSRARREAETLGFDMARFVSLPLQLDANSFGFLGASSVALVSNGFMQIMECLAMACPVIALERGTGVGMNELNIDRRFFPYVSFGEPLLRQLKRLLTWLDSDPFSPEMRIRLSLERHGVSYCATRIEATYYRELWRRSRPPRWRQISSRARRWIWG